MAKNGHIAHSNMPTSIKQIGTRLSKEDYLQYVVGGVPVVLFHYSDLRHDNAVEIHSISTYIPTGENMGKTVRKGVNFNLPLEKHVATLEKGQYVLLDCEGENIVVARTEDLSLLTSLNGEPAELFFSEFDIEENITAASFFHNTPLVVEAMQQWAGREINIILDDKRAYTIIAAADHIGTETATSKVEEYALESKEGEPTVPSEESFKSFLRNIGSDQFGKISIPEVGDFIVTQAIEHPYAQNDLAVTEEFSSVSTTEAPIGEPLVEVTLETDAEPLELEEVSSTIPVDIEGKVKRLKSIKLEKFEKHSQKAFARVNQSNVPEAIHDAEGNTLVVLVPLSRKQEMNEALGSKRVFFHSMEKDFEEYLREVQKETASVVISDRNKGDVALMLSGQTEELIAKTLPADQIVYVDAPTKIIITDPAQDGLEITQVRTLEDYSYERINASKTTVGVKELRDDLLNGKICVLANHKKGIGLFISGQLLDSVAHATDALREVSSYGYQKAIDNEEFLRVDATHDLRIVPQNSPFSGKADYSSKEPYGFISWQSALAFEEQGLLPKIPDEIKQAVNNELDKIKPKSVKKALASIEKPVATPVVAEPVKPDAQKEDIMPSPQTSGVIAIGSVQDVDLSKLSIKERLAAIKATKALGEAISNVRDMLKTSDGFIPVTVNGQKMFVTSNSEFVENAEGISEAFGLGYHSISVTASHQNESISQWVKAFQGASSDNEKLTNVTDTDLKGVVIVPATDHIVSDILPQLDIKLER